VGDADPVILQIQHKLIDKELQLSVTSVGAVLAPEVEERLGESKSKLQRFRDRLACEPNGAVQKRVLIDIEKAEKVRNQAQSDKNKLQEKVGSDMKTKIKGGSSNWQDNLHTICTVLGLGLSIVADVVLPLAGVSCTVM
jgi:hypothetical protein